MYKYYNIKKTVKKIDQCLQRALPIFVKLLNNQIVLDLPKTKIPKANITYQIP